MSKTLEVHGRTGLLAVALIAALGSSGTALAQDWRWTSAIYVWASDVEVEAEVNDREVLDTTADFGDLVKKLDMAFAAHVEGQRGAHGVLFDVNYIDLGDDPKVVDLPGPAPGTAELKGDLSMATFEVAGLYDPSGDGSGFTLIYGTRILDTDLTIDADFSVPVIADRTYHAGGTLYDAMLGARWATDLTERFELGLRGDVAGGGTEFTWNAVAVFGYELGRSGKYSLLAGYRYMNIQLREEDAGAEVESEQTLSGAFVAFAIKV